MTIAAKYDKNKHLISWRIEGLRDTPPEFTLIVNPVNLDISYTQLVNETRTMGGFLQEYWGEQLTTLSAAGRTAMFFGSEGLTNYESRDSEAYQNFIRLLNLYKCNGKEYIDETQRQTLATKANPDRIVGFARVIMIYMNKEYEGYFESFTYKEMAEKPFYIEYDFSFKVNKIIGDLIVQDGNYLVSNG